MSRRTTLILIVLIAAALALGAFFFARSRTPAAPPAQPAPTMELGRPPRVPQYNDGELPILQPDQE